jgi:sulfide dehydrogenase cytochrome subunit
LAIGLLCWALPASADQTPAIDAGCVDCHGADGLASENLNAPVIAGMPAAHIEEAIYAYRDGARQCRFEPMMCETVLHTSDSRIADLAEYYAALPRDSSKEPFDADLAARGKKVHAELCSGCHVRPDDPGVEDALGIPLHGQRGAYLRYALKSYMDGRRENLLEAMEMKLAQLKDGDIDALVNYYASY